MENQDNLATELEALRTAASRLRLGLAVAEPQLAYASATPELPLLTPPQPQITNASPACENRWCQDKSQPRNYLPLTDQIVHEHLSGTKTIGAFPLLKDNTWEDHFK